MRKYLLVPAFLFALPAYTSAQVFESVATGIALDTLEQKANAIVENATRRGDYLVTKGAIEALNAIHAAEGAYQRQLGKTVAEVDGLSRRLNDIDAMLDDAQSKLDGQLSEVGRLEVRIAQVIAGTPLGENGPYLARVTPLIVRPTTSAFQRFTASGVDLVELSLASHAGARTSRIDNQSYLIEIPSSEFSHQQQIGIQTFPMTLTGKRQFLVGPRKTVDTQMTVGVLPSELGRYEYQGTYEEYVREERSIERSPGQMSGTNETQFTWARPTEGWKIDIEKPITIRQSGSDNGDCQGHVENELSSNGIKLEARLDKIGKSWKYPNGAPGRVSCHAKFTEFRMVPTMRSFNGNGTLTWSSDTAFELPNRLASATFKFTLFDGSIVNATGSSREKYFELKRDNQFVVVKPMPPASF